jgi:DNA polymerase
MLKLSKPRKPSKNNRARYFADPADFNKLYSYCKQDIATQEGISKRLGVLPPNERKIWELDQVMNFRGVHVDREAVFGALRILKECQAESEDSIKQMTHGKVETANQVARILDFLRDDLEIDIESLAKDNVEKALQDPDLDPLAREILELRLSSAKSSTKKYQAIADRIDDDNRVRELIVYHGAHSGRWSGRGIQIQNFPRGSIKDQDEVESAIEVIKTGSLDALKLSYENPLDTLSSCLRGMLRAGPESILLCADYNSIEARFLMWLYGEHEAVQMFRDDVDIYSAFAAKIFGRPVNKNDNPDERFLGKIGILGAGYQMGSKKFRTTCADWGLEISQELADKTILAYRRNYPRVRKAWYDAENDAIKAVQSPGSVITRGRISYSCRDGFLYIKLPSGRKIAYYDPQIRRHRTFDKDSLTYMGISAPSYKWARQYTYGGKIVENIIQGCCRDVMAEAMVNLEAAGFPLVLTVHDELVAEVPKVGNVEREFEQFCEIMSTPPSWASTFPATVEGWYGERFRKEK